MLRDWLMLIVSVSDDEMAIDALELLKGVAVAVGQRKGG